MPMNRKVATIAGVCVAAVIVAGGGLVATMHKSPVFTKISQTEAAPAKAMMPAPAANKVVTNVQPMANLTAHTDAPKNVVASGTPDALLAPVNPATPIVHPTPIQPAEAAAKEDVKPVPAVKALTITNITIEPVEAKERGTYRVSGIIINPDSTKKIELTDVHALLKDKDDKTVEDVKLDLPAKKIMAPGESQNFSYTVVASDPSVVRLEVAVDLLR